MHFCPTCENMMHVQLLQTTEADPDGKNVDDSAFSLKYHCPNCKTTQMPSDTNAESNLVFFKSYDQITDETTVMNEYTQYDPTIPTITTVPCPNDQCLSNAAEEHKQFKRISQSTLCKTDFSTSKRT